MTCCDAIIQPFAFVPTLSIPYGAIQQEQYGVEPNVQVYIQEGTEFVLSDTNQVLITATSIEVDFGGPASGVVKVF